MLTTRCPHCHTVFRVRPEQLSVRSGRVRCGHCQQAFSALAYLEEMEGEAPAPASRPADPPAPPPPEPVAEPAPVPVVIAPATQPLVMPSFSARAEPVSADVPPPWRARDAQPVVSSVKPVPEQVPLFQPEVPDPVAAHVPDPEPEPEAPAFASLLSAAEAPAPVMRAIEVEPEVPAVGDDFSMRIIADPDPLAVPAAASEDMDFDFSGLDEAVSNPAPEPAIAPVQSEVGKALGVRAYGPVRDQVFDQTVMLEEPIELMGFPASDNNPDSLFAERERQRIDSFGGQIEDRRHSSGAVRWGLGIVGLLLLAILQLSFVFRVDLARVLPPLRPHLEAACAKLGCTVPYPQDADQIVLEGHSFNPDNAGEGKYHLIVTLLNKAAYQQTWPHLELTVTDRFDIAIARRIFAPAEWLSAPDAALPAFDGHSEITANLPLALRNLQAAGYRLYVFYP